MKQKPRRGWVWVVITLVVLMALREGVVQAASRVSPLVADPPGW